VIPNRLHDKLLHGAQSLIHPSPELCRYREEFVGDAKAVVVGMTCNGFTLAAPNNRGMLDVVGFDTTVPTVVADFVRE
jgi:60 kDa SS-A/Ro ribonucleoprotein